MDLIESIQDEVRKTTQKTSMTLNLLSQLSDCHTLELDIIILPFLAQHQSNRRV